MISTALAGLSLCETRASTKVLIPFLRKVTTNITLIKKVVNLFERVGSLHFRISNQLNRKIGRLAHLNQVLNKEVQDMQVEFLKSKDKHAKE